MVRTRAARRPASAAVLIALAATAAACSSGSPAPTPSPSQSVVAARADDSAALLAQCALSRPVEAVLASAQQASRSLPASQQWLHGSRLVLTKANDGLFDEWFQTHAAGVVVHGRSLDRWEEYAGRHGRLPVAVCGAGVSARNLHNQIYARYPSLKKDNPWNT